MDISLTVHCVSAVPHCFVIIYEIHSQLPADSAVKFSKFVMKSSLNSPSHLARVATLPCEILSTSDN